MTTRLSLRVDLGGTCRIGPGKIRLLEEIAATGSISGAGRAMKMSYKRAWDLVDELNHCFKGPLVTTRIGGHGRGGAELTELGSALIAHYRAIEAKAAAATALHLDAFTAAHLPGAPEPAHGAPHDPGTAP